jgi:hypothetical protein
LVVALFSSFRRRFYPSQPGTVGENVLRHEREVAEQTRVMGLKRDFSLDYGNHRMSDISRNELICRCAALAVTALGLAQFLRRRAKLFPDTVGGQEASFTPSGLARSSVFSLSCSKA